MSAQKGGREIQINDLRFIICGHSLLNYFLETNLSDTNITLKYKKIIT